MHLMACILQQLSVGDQDGFAVIDDQKPKNMRHEKTLPVMI
jgi:hypothetical protein